MSIIIDGMDQSHCKVPYLGTQNSFSSPLKQCITGVKEHGYGVTLYRTIDTVRKGADLTIFCVLSQIESWKKRYKSYPEELYLQVDGGSENANQYLLSMLELLVVKRMCRLVYYSRLPTGHTHEDIDACFALVWLCFRNKPCETLQGYKKIIEETLDSTSLNAKVIDVYIIPSWQTFFDGCIDSRLSKLHHDIQTQHQWRFEAVQSVHFPAGCKTTYKAYSSDQVVEFIKKPKQQCISQIGQYIGLEPTTLFCPWYPAARGCGSDPRRQGIEGFYLLRKIPHCENNTLPPCPFPPNARASINATLSEVRSRYDINDDAIIREAWSSWASDWAPQSDDVNDYIIRMKERRLAYYIPLKNILLKSNKILETSWSIALNVAEINAQFQWPTVFAMSMNSVVTDFNPNASDPRLYVMSDNMLQGDILSFSERRVLYYEQVASMNSATLISKLKQKLTFDGKVMPTAG